MFVNNEFVVVFEDHRFHRTITAAILSSHHYAYALPRDAQSLNAGSRLLNTATILLLDLSINGPEGGFKLAREIHTAHPTLPIILMSDSERPGAIGAADDLLRDGVLAGVVLKKFLLERLPQLLQKIISEHAQKSEASATAE